MAGLDRQIHDVAADCSYDCVALVIERPMPDGSRSDQELWRNRCVVATTVLARCDVDEYPDDGAEANTSSFEQDVVALIDAAIATMKSLVRTHGDAANEIIDRHATTGDEHPTATNLEGP